MLSNLIPIMVPRDGHYPILQKRKQKVRKVQLFVQVTQFVHCTAEFKYIYFFLGSGILITVL